MIIKYNKWINYELKWIKNEAKTYVKDKNDWSELR